MQRTYNRGFTLIELLVIIAILGLLASVLFSQLAIARTKSEDSRKKADMYSVRTALTAFHLDNGRMPNNYSCSGASCVVDNNRSTIAIEDTASPENPTTESGKAYKASMQELVDGKYLPQIPRSPNKVGYTYYDYGPRSSAGAMFGTSLGAETPSATGAPGSCRPFDAPVTGGGLGGLNPRFGIDDRFDTCLYEESGRIVERPCPQDEEDVVESSSPVVNLCSTTVSRDYCLCSRY